MDQTRWINVIAWDDSSGVAMGSPLGPSLSFLVDKNPNQFLSTILLILLTILFSSSRMISRSIFENSSVVVISRQRDRTTFPFSMLKLFANKVNLRPQFIVNLPLVTYIVTKIFFNLLFVNLMWHTP